jgi:hypothetical protein
MSAHQDQRLAALEREREEAKRRLEEARRRVAEARARYDAATQIILQAVANGAQLPPGVDVAGIAAGPYEHPDGIEAGERAFWGLPPKGTPLV